MPNLIIGSRGSKLALWQANWIKNRLERIHPGLIVAIEIIKTTGDKMTEASLAQIGGKGVFTKEIEDALIDRQIDLAVHSLKDLPTTLPEGLHIAAITEREDVRDALIVGQALMGGVWAISELPWEARVGTSSLRRAAQLRFHRPDLKIIELRGNVDTRLKKLEDDQYDAIVLASAGLIRLGYGDRITAQIDVNEILTAVGQGALGIESRIDDQRINILLEPLNHWPTRHATEAERAVLRELGGGCAVPIAALGRIRKDRSDGRKTGRLILDALVADVEGRRVIRRQASGKPAQAEALGAELAFELVEAGARDLLPRIGAGAKAAAQTPNSVIVLEPIAVVQTPMTSIVAEELIESEIEPEIEPENEREVEPEDLSEPEVEAAESPEAEIAPEETALELPLEGARIILTRAAKQSGELTRSLEALGAEVIACPTIEIQDPPSWEALDRALIHLSWYDWLTFTSVNGVEYFLRRLDELGHLRTELDLHKICAVGKKTAERLSQENISIDLMPEKFTAEAVVEEFTKRFGSRRRLEGAQMLMPASTIARDVIRPAMEKIGVYVEVVDAYQTVRPQISMEDIISLLREADADYIIFTSPSTVSNLAALLETDDLEPHLSNLRIACIGPATSDAARAHGLDVHIQPEEHTGEAIVNALTEDRSTSRVI